MIKKQIKERQKLLKNDNEFDKFKKYIEARFNELLKHYLIDFVNIQFSYPMKQPLDTRPGVKWVLTIIYVKRYRTAYVKMYDFSFDMFKRKMYDDLDRAILHELNHIHTIPPSDIASNRHSSAQEIEDAFEELTEIMTEYMVRYLKIKEKHNVKKKKSKPKKSIINKSKK